MERLEEVQRCFILKKQALLCSIVILCLLLPGCTTIPTGNKLPSWTASRAEQAAVHAGARLLQEKTSTLELPDQDNSKGFPSNAASASTGQTGLPDRDVEIVSINRLAKSLFDLMFHKLFFAIGWECGNAKVPFPADALSGVKPCYFMGKSTGDSLVETDSERNGKPTARYNGRKVFAGFRWTFIVAHS
jgi:hypothetical protein